MPLFCYKAINKKNTVVDDTIVAQSREDAVAILRNFGMRVLTIKNIESQQSNTLIGSISVVEKAMFCRFLATMLRAGLPLLEAIDIIKKETRNKRFSKILSDVIFQVQKGRNLSSILSQYKDDFDSVFVTIVKAGEESGNMDSAFDYLAKQLLANHEIVQKVRGAMMYPAIIVLSMLGVGTIIVTFVLPRVSTAFSNLKMDMPWTTKLVFGVGTFINNNFYFVLAMMVFSVISTIIILSIKPTRTMVIQLIERIPAVKAIVIQFDVARFSRTLSVLLKSGVSVLDALNVSSEVVTEIHLRHEAKLLSANVAKGISLGEVLSQHKSSFPMTLIQTIKAGEKTGKLDEVLLEMAEFYEREVDYTLKRFTSLLEPLLMLAVGVAVGAMVITIIAPIYSIVGGLQSTMTR